MRQRPIAVACAHHSKEARLGRFELPPTCAVPGYNSMSIPARLGSGRDALSASVVPARFREKKHPKKRLSSPFSAVYLRQATVADHIHRS